MSHYFIRQNHKNLGPFTKEELKGMPLSKEDYVWKEGAPAWVQAKEVIELKELWENTATSPPFTLTSNPVPADSSLSIPPPAKKRSLLKVVLWGLLLIGVLGFAGLEYYRSTYPTYEGDMETNHPKVYLHTEGSYHSNLLNQVVIDGVVSNSAAHTGYKDVVIRVNFYSKTESLIGSEDFVLYEYIPFGTKKTFKLKVRKPAGAKTCGWEVEKATPY